MPPDSLARSFFDKLLAPGTDHAANSRALVNSDPPTFEDDWFDVKIENPKQRDEKNTRKIWSEVLGGFANNQGGVVIWGLDARKKEIDGRMIDAVSDEAPLDDVIAFTAKLTDWRRQATDPPLPNVEIVPVPLPDNPKKGFVVCFVPEGQHKPYRSEDAGKNYFLRSGDNTVVMSRSVLASMFYPKSKVLFRVRASLVYDVNRDINRYQGQCVAPFLLRAELENIGSATAKDTTLWVTPVETGTGKTPSISADDRWVLSQEGDRSELRIRAIAIHPRQAVQLFSCQWLVPVRIAEGNRLIPNCPNPGFEIIAFCENHERQVFRPKFDLHTSAPQQPQSWEGCSEEQG